MSGIERDVFLWSQPRVAVRDFRIKSTLDEACRDGIFALEADLTNRTEGDAEATLSYELLDDAGRQVAAGQRDAMIAAGGCRTPPVRGRHPRRQGLERGAPRSLHPADDPPRPRRGDRNGALPRRVPPFRVRPAGRTGRKRRALPRTAGERAAREVQGREHPRTSSRDGTLRHGGGDAPRLRADETTQLQRREALPLPPRTGNSTSCATNTGSTSTTKSTSSRTACTTTCARAARWETTRLAETPHGAHAQHVRTEQEPRIGHILVAGKRGRKRIQLLPNLPLDEGRRQRLDEPACQLRTGAVGVEYGHVRSAVSRRGMAGRDRTQGQRPARDAVGVRSCDGQLDRKLRRTMGRDLPLSQPAGRISLGLGGPGPAGARRPRTPFLGLRRDFGGEYTPATGTSAATASYCPTARRIRRSRR